MQVFQKNRAWVAGTDEAIAILKLCLTDGYSFSDLEVSSLRDGDRVGPWETVMLIRGPYAAFAHLEDALRVSSGPSHQDRDPHP